MSNDGSLLRLFNYEGFTLEMLLEYLHKRESPGITSYLINKLYDYPLSQIEFYIPQMLLLYFNKPSCSELEKLLLKASIDLHSFALTLHFNLTAYSGDCSPDHKIRSEQFLESLDMVVVNALMPKQTSEQPPPHLYRLPSDETEIDSFNRKTVRSEYYTYQMKIINILCKISVGLNAVPLEQRDETLKSWLASVNTMILDTRNKYSKSSPMLRRLFRGPVINFHFEGDQENSISQIVRILYDKSFCVCTKARVPYKILMESIELHEYDVGSASPALHHSDSEIINELNTVDVETINKLMHKDDRFEGYNEYVEHAEQEEGVDSPKLPVNGEGEKSENVSVWGESWTELSEKIRENSPFGGYESWKLRGFIVKGLDDLRQEYLAMQFISKLKTIWEQAHLQLYLRPYEIKIVSNYMGILEFIPDTLSLHTIKKNSRSYTDLESFFLENWPTTFEEAQRNFVQSMAGYSLVCYLLNIKDRHNANILLDALGHIIHIDFGFFFTISPGGNIGFESAPFKLTSDMIGVMGGIDSEMFGYFKMLLLQGFLEIRKHADALCLLLEMMGPESNLPCLRDYDRAVSDLRERMQLPKTDEKCLAFIDSLVYYSQNNWRTTKYDEFQYLSNGIL